MSNWPDQSGNKLNQTYIKGFLDISGGDITIRNNGNINIGKNALMNGNLTVGNNSIMSGNVTIGQNTTPYFLYDFEVTDIYNNINNVIQAIPPPGLFLLNSLTINNQKDALTFKNGQYDVSASSFTTGNDPFKAFNGYNIPSTSITNVWQSGNTYNDNGTYRGTYSDNGFYRGSVVTNYLSGINTYSVSGEWIQIALPYSFILTKYSFLCNTPSTSAGPKSYSILGSNTGNSWNLIVNNTVLSNAFGGTSPYSTTTPTTFLVTNNPQPFTYYRLVVSTIWPGSNTNTAMQQWNLYGNPYSSSVIPTNLLYNYSSNIYDSLFSSSISSMIDSTLSITGTSSVKFDGINNYIVLPYFPVTNTGLTFSCWIRPIFPQTGTKIYTIFEFINSSNTISLTLNTTTGNNISWQTTNLTVNPISNSAVSSSTWTHIAWTIPYDTGNNSTWRFYVNGVNVSTVVNQSSPTVGDFFINYIGRSNTFNNTYSNYQDFYGNIDNFRVYNTVLTSFQIGSLYNIQKSLTINNLLYYHYNDVFLGNKLAVLGDTSLNNNGTTASTSSTTGALIVSGGAGIRGNLNVSATTASTSTITGAFIVSGGAGFGGNVNISNDVGIGGNASVGSTVNSTSITTGSFVVSGGAGIARNTNIGGNVKIGGAAVSTDLSSGALITSGGAAITGNLNVGANTIIYSATPSVSPITGALTISGGLGMFGNLYIGSITESIATTNGSLVVSGGAGIVKNANIGGNVKIGGGAVSTDLSSGALITSGGAAITGNLNVGANAIIYSATPSISSVTGALTISGGLGMGGNLYIGSITESNATTNGSFVVSGGVGIAKNTNIGGNLNVNSNAESSSTSSGAFVVSGGVGIGGNLNVAGNTKINTSTASTSTTTGALIVVGGVGITGNINIGGSISSGSVSSPQFNSPNNILTTGNAPNYYLLGRISGKNLRIDILSGPNAAVANTLAEVCTITGVIFTDGTISASYYTNGKNLVIDNIYLNRIDSTANYDVYIHTNTNYVMQCYFNIYNVNGTWTVNPTLNTEISAGTVSTLTSTWITLQNSLNLTSSTISTSATTGAFIVAGGVGIGGNLNLSATTASTSGTTGAFVVSGGVGIGGNLNLSATTASTSSTTGTFVVAGGAGIGGNVNIGSTTESSSVSTGSLVISGGVGITKNTNIGGNLKITGTAVSTDLSSGSFIVSGGAGIGGNINIGGISKLYATTSSVSTTTGALIVSGGLGVGENVNIGGNTNVIGTLNSTGLMSCSGGLVTLAYTITNTALTVSAKLHNSYIYFSGSSSSVSQTLPDILANLSSIIHLVNVSSRSHTIVCGGTNTFIGNFTGSSISLPAGYSMRLISGGSNWFVDNYRYNNSKNIDTETDILINGLKTFNRPTTFNSTLTANTITDNGDLTSVQSLSATNNINAGGTLSAVGITDNGDTTTVNSLTSTGTVSANGITDSGNTILGTSRSNTFTAKSVSRLDGGMANLTFSLNSTIAATSSFYGANIIFLSTITSGNINQHIPTAVVPGTSASSGSYSTTIFLANYSNTAQQIWSDGGKFYGQSVDNGNNPSMSLQPNYCVTLKSDGTNWSVQNTQHITNVPIDNASTQTISGLKTFSSNLNVNGGIYYKNIAVVANSTIGDSNWYGSTIDISNSSTWTTTLPTAANNTNIYIWNHSAVAQTINAFSSNESFFGYNITNNSSSFSIPAYTLVALRSTPYNNKNTWYAQPFVQQGSFYMDNYSNQSISGTKTFTGSSIFGTSKTDIKTVNANMVLTGGLYTSFVTISPVSESIIGIEALNGFIKISGGSTNGNVYLPSSVSSRTGQIHIYNSDATNSYNIKPASGSSDTLTGQGSGTNVMAMTAGMFCTFIFSSGTWYCINKTISNASTVNDTTDQTINGNKTFGSAVTLPSVNFTNATNQKKLVLYNSSSNLNAYTSFYGFGVTSSTLSYNVDSTNSNHIFYTANTSDSASNIYLELLKIGNGGILASRDITINTGYKIITPTITLNGSDLGAAIASAPTLAGTNTFTGNNTFNNTVTASAFNTTSDYRIKENIISIKENAAFTVDKLKPIHYYNTNTQKEDIGILAHELQEEYPFLVNGEKDGERYQSVNYNGLIGILIKEIQELKTRIALLER